MELQNRQELYRSSNGHRWDIGRDANSKLVVVHTANEAAGGNVSTMDFGMFLAVGHHGPEHQALLRLLRSGGLDAQVQPLAAASVQL